MLIESILLNNKIFYDDKINNREENHLQNG